MKCLQRTKKARSCDSIWKLGEDFANQWHQVPGHSEAEGISKAIPVKARTTPYSICVTSDISVASPHLLPGKENAGVGVRAVWAPVAFGTGVQDTRQEAAVVHGLWRQTLGGLGLWKSQDLPTDWLSRAGVGEGHWALINRKA